MFQNGFVRWSRKRKLKEAEAQSRFPFKRQTSTTSTKSGDDSDSEKSNQSTAGKDSAESAVSGATGVGPSGGSMKSALKVNIPSELEGTALIQVSIHEDNEQLASANLSTKSLTPGDKQQPQEEMHWQSKLEAAQNVLFCKELFFQLAREAIQIQSKIPHLVVGDQIRASLFADVQLNISFCHSTGKESKSAESSAAFAKSKNDKNGVKKEESKGKEDQKSKETTGLSGPKNHNYVLEHSLYQLLRQQHSQNINPERPVLSTAPIGISKRRRLAGPRAADRSSLLDMATTPTLLEQIIAQAQHVVLRKRTMSVLDEMSFERRDPLISCHWSTTSSPTATSVKVNVITNGFDSLHRTQLVINVGHKQLSVVCRDGRVMKFSHESQELRDFILCQIAHHQVRFFT